MSVRVATVQLEGVSPFSEARYHNTPYQDQESHDKYRARTWREHLHYDPATKEVFIPPMMIKKALTLAANRMSMRIPGKGQKTYAAFFRSGIMVNEPAGLGIKKDEVGSEDLFLPADGKAGSGKRVLKTYPRIEAGWKTTAKVYVLDNTITDEVFQKHMEEAGKYVGLGRFRPERDGYYGRFNVKKITWDTEG